MRPLTGLQLEEAELTLEGRPSLGAPASVSAQVNNIGDLDKSGVDLQALFEPKSNSGGRGGKSYGGVSTAFGEANELISTGELGPGVALQGTTGSPGGGADELL